MKLRSNQQCPIHRSLYCCGREVVLKKHSVKQLGVQRIEDPHHSRGYRELRSNAEMRNIQAVHWWCNGEKGSSRV